MTGYQRKLSKLAEDDLTAYFLSVLHGNRHEVKQAKADMMQSLSLLIRNLTRQNHAVQAK